MKRILILAAVCILGVSVTTATLAGSKGHGAGSKDHANGHGASGAVAPDKALEKLVEGNRRFVKGGITHLHLEPAERAGLAAGQKPFAIVVGCADSRVPPELVFDYGLGNLFVVRVAGQVLDDPSLGSIEYAAEHLGSRLVVVLGHEKCGAVKAAVDGGDLPGHLPRLVDPIRPAVAQAKGMKGDLLHNAVRANVNRVVRQIETSEPILSELVHNGTIRIVGGVYDLSSGKVEFFTE